MRIGLVATVVGSAALVGILFSNTGHKNASHFRKGRPQVVAPNPTSVAFTPREQREVWLVTQQFVATAVLRNHPERSYDLVFFAFWLSHVPPGRFDEFWHLVRLCVGDSGRMAFVDEDEERALPADAGRITAACR